MKLLPSIVVLVVSIAGGWVIGPMLARASAETSVAPEFELDAEQVREVAYQRAVELVDELPPPSEEDLEAEKARLMSNVQLRLDELTELSDIVDRTEATVESAKAILGDPGNRGERDTRLVALRILRSPLKLGKALLAATDASVRRRGLREIQRAARRGDEEAFAILIRAFYDHDDGIQAEARRQALSLVSRRNDEVLELVRSSGLEAELVAYLPSAKGRDKRRVLDALTHLENPAATQGWREVFVGETQIRNRIEAARALQKLGSTSEYEEVLVGLNEDLFSGESRRMRRSISSLVRLGGDGAKAALQSALDADPEGPNARRLKQGISSLEGNRRGRRQRRR